MESYNTPTEKDPQLWEIAKRRASFKGHLLTYITVNAFLWTFWLFSGRQYDSQYGFPWPIFPTVGWGIGIVMHYIGAYIHPRSGSVEREYEKLIQQKKNNF